MTEDFLVYRISYDEVVKRLEARYDRKQGANITAVEFTTEEPKSHFFFGKSHRTITRATIALSRELPYTRITVRLNEQKFSGALFIAVIFASILLYWVFKLWYIPVLLMFKATVFWVFIRIQTANKLESLVAGLKRLLVD